MALDLARLRNSFAAAAKDGTIDKKEVDTLLRQVKVDGLTESEARTLKLETRRYQDHFSDDASKTINDFITNKLRELQVLDDPTPTNPLGIKDPAVLPADAKRVHQEVINGGELVRNGVSGNDVMQKYLGDCYLMASMSSIAHDTPKAITDAFKRNRDGSYTVRIFEKKGHGFEPTYVTIDADLPRNDWYHLEYGSGRDEKELWPALLEKAFAARAKGGYAGIEGGLPGEAMSAITGKPSTDLDLRAAGTTPDQVFATLKAAIAAGKPTTAVTLGESSNAKYTNTGVYADHTYSVWGVSTEGGKRYVELRNPWGSGEPANNGRDDGIFKLELSQFLSLYCGLSING